MHLRRQCQAAGRERSVSSAAVSGRGVSFLGGGRFAAVLAVGCGPGDVGGCKLQADDTAFGRCRRWRMLALAGGRFASAVGPSSSGHQAGGDPVASGLVVPEAGERRRGATSVGGDSGGW